MKLNQHLDFPLQDIQQFPKSDKIKIDMLEEI